MRRCTVLLLSLFLAILVGCPISAGAATTLPADTWQISVLTFGPGPLIFERFGHAAIRVRNDARRVDVCYDWGNFSFADPMFVPRFVRGELRYWKQGKHTADILPLDGGTWDRTVVEQTLHLDPQQTQRLIHLLEDDLDADGRFYFYYDSFVDNCSTRIRDTIDAALGGAMRRQTTALTPHSTRWQVRRVVPVGAANVAMGIGIDFLFGPRTDRPLTQWEAAFLPTHLADAMDAVRIPNANGDLVPLVGERRLLNRSDDPGTIEPTDASNPLWWTLPAGLLGAVALLALARVWRLGFVIGATLWESFVLGCSLLLTFMTFFTTHRVIGWNQNFLQFSPLAVVVLAAILRRRWRARLVWAPRVAVAFSVVGLLLALSHLAVQTVAPAVALCLPMHVAVLLGLRPRPFVAHGSLEPT